MIPVYDLFNHRNVQTGTAVAEGEGPALAGYNTIVDMTSRTFKMVSEGGGTSGGLP